MTNKINPIFRSKTDDFFKVFAGTILLFIIFKISNIWTTSFFTLVTIYFFDGGHVYSTFLEVVFDGEEVKKQYVAVVILGSFFLNLLVHVTMSAWFFTFIFYFTIYHNMRQGLGVTFLYRAGERNFSGFIRFTYYFLTMIPFILYHFRNVIFDGKVSESILKPMHLSILFDASYFQLIFYWGTISYVLLSVLIFLFLIIKKQLKGLLTMLFFGLIYAYSFLISANEFQSYALLIFSHAIPYFFLMQRRLELTHQSLFMRKWAVLFLGFIFLIGGILDYYQDDLISLSDPFESLGVALLFTPLISHFIFDAIIWRRNNERFQVFNKS